MLTWPSAAVVPHSIVPKILLFESAMFNVLVVEPEDFAVIFSVEVPLTSKATALYDVEPLPLKAKAYVKVEEPTVASSAFTSIVLAEVAIRFKPSNFTLEEIIPKFLKLKSLMFQLFEAALGLIASSLKMLMFSCVSAKAFTDIAPIVVDIVKATLNARDKVVLKFFIKYLLKKIMEKNTIA